MEITTEKQRENAIKWIKALLSGQYEQCDSYMRMLNPINKKLSYCCWGVGRHVLGLDINVLESWDDLREVGDRLFEHVGFNDSMGAIKSSPIEYQGLNYYSLGNANDIGVPFKVIAKHLITKAEFLFNKEVAKFIKKEFTEYTNNGGDNNG